MNKIFISAEEGWKELKASVDSCLVPFAILPEAIPFKPIAHDLTFTFDTNRKTRLALLRELGFLKPRKTTHKTVKRDCAKRNR